MSLQNSDIKSCHLALHGFGFHIIVQKMDAYLYIFQATKVDIYKTCDCIFHIIFILLFQHPKVGGSGIVGSCELFNKTYTE